MAYTGIPMWRRIRYFFSNRVRLIIGLIVAVGLVVLIDDFLPNGILGRQKALDRAEAICIQEYIEFSNPTLDAMDGHQAALGERRFDAVHFGQVAQRMRSFYERLEQLSAPVCASNMSERALKKLGFQEATKNDFIIFEEDLRRFHQAAMTLMDKSHQCFDGLEGIAIDIDSYTADEADAAGENVCEPMTTAVTVIDVHFDALRRFSSEFGEELHKLGLE